MTGECVYSVCGMCTVRCPIEVNVSCNMVKGIRGNRNVAAMKGAICPRGAAGAALVSDRDRPAYPMIRTGERGEGKWRKASWDEALDYAAGKLKEVMASHGARSVAFSDRGGPFIDLHKAFLKGLGSPNYTNHDSSCAKNVHHSSLSLFGMGRKDFVYDFKNAKHVVLQFRNIFEAINVSEVNNLMDGIENGARLTVIDIRANVSASKAQRFFMVRPGSDHAFNLAVINELITAGLYDKDFAARHINGMEELSSFIRPYTPEWAEAITGIAPFTLREFVNELAKAAPAVIWHPGWMAARYTDSFHICRSIYIINALLGSIGAKGGLAIANKPGDFGKNGLKALTDLFPKPIDERADGAGSKYPHFEAGTGLAHLNYLAMDSGEPYPLTAYIAYRHDPLMAYPDPDELTRIFAKLDFLMSVTFSWSDTAWFSDVVLPLSTYLERESIVASKNGLKPQFFVRERAVEPRYDTKADWEIITGLARRLGLSELAFDSIEDIRRYQLEGTGVDNEDFRAKGFVELADKAVYKDMAEFRFKTPSGKIEMISGVLESQGLKSLKPYEEKVQAPEGEFRLTFGRCAVHTQGHTLNNPLLFEQMPENMLWINDQAAAGLGVSDGDTVKMSRGDFCDTIKAKVTPLIHKDAVFLIHGFGHRLPVESRACGKGVADNRFMQGGLKIWDRAGGSVAFQEHFVRVEKA